MQTIIMTVGTSLLRNPDRGMERPRPWLGEREIGDRSRALKWMGETDLEVISAEINTLWRLDPRREDEVVLLYSDTPEGWDCATVLQAFLTTNDLFGQQVSLHKLPGINYELDEAGSSLEQMAKLVRRLIEQARGTVTLAATGGFKAQTMIMALVGNACKVPVCYIHEQYSTLVYLPFLTESGQFSEVIQRAQLPESSKTAAEKVRVQTSKSHHRPKTWQKVEQMLRSLPWVEYVRFDEKAFAAPKNGVKLAIRGTDDGRKVFWLHLFESQESRMAIAIETTGYTSDHAEQAGAELRLRLARIVS